MSRTSAQTGVVGVALLGVILAAGAATPHASVLHVGPTREPEALDARVWLDGGDNPLFQRGETSRLSYQTSTDAFVAVLQIDTNGGVRLLFPTSPDENNFVRGGAENRLLFPRSPVWQVEDDPGVGYFFIIASPLPLDFSALTYSHYDRGWDLSAVGRNAYGDPLTFVDKYAASLVPGRRSVPYAMDVASYQVGLRQEYPRFLCYECHDFRAYSVWNPYRYTCSSFRVVRYGNPYDYPATSFQGTQVVYQRAATRFGFKERTAGEPATPLVVLDGSGSALTRPTTAETTPGAALRPSATPPRVGVPSPGAPPPVRAGQRTPAPTGIQAAPRSGAPTNTGSAPIPSMQAPAGAPRSTGSAPATTSAPATGSDAQRTAPPPRTATPTTSAPTEERARPVLAPRPTSEPPRQTEPASSPTPPPSSTAQPRPVPQATR